MIEVGRGVVNPHCRRVRHDDNVLTVVIKNNSKVNEAVTEGTQNIIQV